MYRGQVSKAYTGKGTGLERDAPSTKAGVAAQQSRVSRHRSKLNSPVNFQWLEPKCSYLAEDKMIHYIKTTTQWEFTRLKKQQPETESQRHRSALIKCQNFRQEADSHCHTSLSFKSKEVLPEHGSLVMRGAGWNHSKPTDFFKTPGAQCTGKVS